MSLVGNTVMDSRLINRPARTASLDTAGLISSAKELRKADSIRSVGNACHTASSGECPPRSKRARREVEIRVWEWLDVSVRRDGSVTPIGAFDLGHMKLSEGSPATTALTAALDAPPCDAVEPCVSSLPDAPVLGESGCVSSKLTTGQEQEGPLEMPHSHAGNAVAVKAAASNPSEVQDADEAISRRQQEPVASASQHASSRGIIHSIGEADALCTSTEQQQEQQRVGDVAERARPSLEGSPEAAKQPHAGGRTGEGGRVPRQNSRKRKHSVDAERRAGATESSGSAGLRRTISADPAALSEPVKQ